MNEPRIERIKLSCVDVDVLRLDLHFGGMSGNKLLKLQHLIADVEQARIKKVVSFGGAYSNHLHALAHFAHLYGIASVGVVRGEAVSNPTLEDCKRLGMDVMYCEREEFDTLVRNKTYDAWASPQTAVVAMGGDDERGIEGVRQYFATETFRQYRTIVVSVGTATTLLGIAHAQPLAEIVGVATHHDLSLRDKVRTLSPSLSSDRLHIHFYHALGGFGKMSPEVVAYMNEVYAHFGIPLDVVYTAKTMHYLQQHIATLAQPILFVHTGGLQGNRSVASSLIF